MARHVRALADDSMRGRATLSPEIEKAAAYVAAAFARAGLEPAGEAGAYIQRYTVGRDTAAASLRTAPNVVGLLRGRDPALRGEVVAVVAHMDHVGVAGRDRGCSAVGADSVCNGANDNASGTAGVLALAEAFAAQPVRPRRSILFLVVSGEERGLLGSRAFVARPSVPLDSMVALVNLDMIGRNRPDSVYLSGWGKSTISGLVRELAAQHGELGLAVGPDEEDRPVSPGDSDHYPFQRQGVPYIFFFAGSHSDYHSPGDEFALLDADKAARVTRLAFYTMWEVAERTGRPKWDPAARRLNVVERKR
jgi:Zn-dependent M28 family amino/carboxypeptidase